MKIIVKGYYSKGVLAIVLGFLLYIIAGPARAQDRNAPDDVFVPSKSVTRLDSVSYDSVLTYYADLYPDLLTRKSDSLWSWLDHSLSSVRGQAWRGMVHTEETDIYRLELEAEEADRPAAWMALAHHSIPKGLLRILEQRWEKGEHSRSGISRVLGRQGDYRSLTFLMDHLDEVKGSPDEFPTALAIGRLTLSHELSNSDQFKLIRSAFTTSDPNITRAYLYGAYRSDTTLLNPELQQNLYRLWQVYGIGVEQKIDQYMVKILGRNYPQSIFQVFDGWGADSLQPRLGIELAVLLRNSPVDTSARRLARKLLAHPNPQVVQTTLKSLQNQDTLGAALTPFVRDSLLPDESMPEMLRAEAFQTVMGTGTLSDSLSSLYVHRLDSLRRSNPYLLPDFLDILRIHANSFEYLNTVDSVLKEVSPPTGTFAARDLVEFWKKQKRGGVSDSLRKQVREAMFAALESGDRGTVYEITPLLKDSLLLKHDEFPVLKRTLRAFRLPADIEVYQSLAGVLHERFPGKARPLIDSLAAYGYGALNQHFRSVGWSIESGAEDDAPQTKPADQFRMPDWERLAELGPEPVWVLRLKGDTLRIRLDPLRAPATVSAIDSLTRANAYDSVAFHRVVPNFVVQGGDFKRGDGFGGPDFTLPTEPSEIHYTRGSVGIASAGVDTEGSQFFIMHQWKPHLNGNYTRFGYVIEGMGAVDRLMEGDRVLEAWME